MGGGGQGTGSLTFRFRFAAADDKSNRPDRDEPRSANDSISPADRLIFGGGNLPFQDDIGVNDTCSDDQPGPYDRDEKSDHPPFFHVRFLPIRLRVSRARRRRSSDRFRFL